MCYFAGYEDCSLPITKFNQASRLPPSTSSSHPPTPLAPACCAAASPKEADQSIKPVDCAVLGKRVDAEMMCSTSWYVRVMKANLVYHLLRQSLCPWCTSKPQPGIITWITNFDRISRVNGSSSEENLLPRKDIFEANWANPESLCLLLCLLDLQGLHI